MSVLITGAGGLIGRHLVAALEGDTEVWAVTRRPERFVRAHHIEADLADRSFIASLPARVDAVVHLAQSPHYRDFPERALDVFNVNVASTALLLDWAQRAGVRRFVLASAGGADRAGGGAALPYYLSTKRSAELLAHAYVDRFCVTVLRFFFVYGRGQRRSMLMPRLVDTVRDGRPITLAGSNGMRLNPVHVDDAIAALRAAAATDHAGVFDIAGPEVLTLRDVGETIGARLGLQPRFVVEDRHDPDLVGDTARMRTDLAAPRRTLASGLEDLL